MELWTVKFEENSDIDSEECNGMYLSKEKAFSAIDELFQKYGSEGYLNFWKNRKIYWRHRNIINKGKSFIREEFSLVYYDTETGEWMNSTTTEFTIRKFRVKG